MKHPMRSLLAFVVLAACASLAQDLPAAPSAAKTEAEQQQQAPAAQPAAAPATQPAAPSAPTLEPLTKPVPEPDTTSPAPSSTASAATSNQTKPQPTAVSQPPQPLKQADPKKSDDEEDVPLATIKKRVDEVNVIFTVTDKGGHFIKGLKENDFTVMDDHKPPQSMVAFRSETNLPLRVGLLVDASNSIRDRFKFEQDAAAEFLNQTVRARVDKAFVVGFDSTPEVTADFTDNTEKLSRGVAVLRPGGGTALWDAIYYACRDKLMKYPDEIAVRRAIVVLSDGDDNQSRVTRQEAIEMAQRAEVIVYAISTNISGVVSRGDKYLEEISEATGGRTFFPMKLQDIADQFGKIQEELRSQYAVAYKPTDFQADGKYRSIDIAAANKKYKVRARKGYYAPRQ
jgi:VWFA-related protein